MIGWGLLKIASCKKFFFFTYWQNVMRCIYNNVSIHLHIIAQSIHFYTLWERFPLKAGQTSAVRQSSLTEAKAVSKSTSDKLTQLSNGLLRTVD